MDKKQAFKVIYSCCKVYQCNLASKNFLFIYRNCNEKPYTCFEATFRENNFHHLTGTVLNKNVVDSAADFFDACINNRLAFNSFEMKTDGTTVLKLQILPSLMQIHTCAKMIGDFDGSSLYLQTEKLVGGIKGCIGFKKQGSIYVPNTVMQCDIRNFIADPYGKIDAIFSKKLNSSRYLHLRYISKRLKNCIPMFPNAIENLIDRKNIIYCCNSVTPESNIYD